MKTDDKTLITALETLAKDTQSNDGVANACIAEAAQRLKELTQQPATTDRAEALANIEEAISKIISYDEPYDGQCLMSGWVKLTTIDTIRAALTSSMSVPQWQMIETSVPQWQTIDTAPRDGKCLVYVETEKGGEIHRLDRDESGDWLHEGEPTYCHSYWFSPTHWMPLPQPPEEGK